MRNRYFFILLVFALGCHPAHRPPSQAKQNHGKTPGPQKQTAPDQGIPPEAITVALPDEINVDGAIWPTRGVTLLSSPEEPYGTSGTCGKLNNLQQKLNINSIAVRQYVFMDHYDQADLYENPAVTLAQLGAQVQVNKLLGLKTAFILGTTIQTASRDAGGCQGGTWVPWHGVVDLKDPAEYDKWFAGYQNVILKYAKWAAGSGGVSLFSLGNELESLATTKPLASAEDIKDFVGNLNYALNSTDAVMKAYGTTVVEHVLSFQGINEPNGKPGLGQELRHPIKTIENKIHPDPDVEISQWARTGKGSALGGGLSSRAQFRLAFLENIKRQYLLKKWTGLISQVRQVFANVAQASRPLLSYNVNFSSLDQILFWPQLDEVSISAYFPLADRDQQTGAPIAVSDITVDFLKTKFMTALKNVGPFVGSLPNHPPVIFSEIGFTNREFTTLHPWAFSGCDFIVKPGQSQMTQIMNSAQPYDNAERTRALEALEQLATSGQLSWLKGIYLWNVYTGADLNSGDDYSLYASSKPTGNSDYEGAVQKIFNATSGKSGKPAAPTIGLCSAP